MCTGALEKLMRPEPQALSGFTELYGGLFSVQDNTSAGGLSNCFWRVNHVHKLLKPAIQDADKEKAVTELFQVA